MWWSDPGSTKMPANHWTAPLFSLLVGQCLACRYPAPTQLVWVEPVILHYPAAHALAPLHPAHRFAAGGVKGSFFRALL